MASYTKTKDRNKQKKMFALFLSVIIVNVFIVYLGFFRESKPQSNDTVSNFNTIDVPKRINLNTELFQDARLYNLETYSRISKDILTGRKNPFLPYPTSTPASSFSFTPPSLRSIPEPVSTSSAPTSELP
jgi:hypothetical protein